MDESTSGLTDEPGVWVDPPVIDLDRLGAMIREQSDVTDLATADQDVQDQDFGEGF